MKTPKVILRSGEMEKGGIVISWFGLAGKKSLAMFGKCGCAK
jgi:hypothetical protein